MRYTAVTSAWLLIVAALGKLETFQPAYVGVERCRLCHRSVYQSWADTAHRGATELLPDHEPPRGCFRCHSTGPGLPGVQCEACHGAGGNYWPAEIMGDPEKAREAGLTEPTESVCRTCHGSGLPNHSSQFSMPGEAELLAAIH